MDVSKKSYQLVSLFGFPLSETPIQALHRILLAPLGPEYKGPPK